MDLSVGKKIKELQSQGKSREEIHAALVAGGYAAEDIDAVLEIVAAPAVPTAAATPTTPIAPATPAIAQPVVAALPSAPTVGLPAEEKPARPKLPLKAIILAVAGIAILAIVVLAGLHFYHSYNSYLYSGLKNGSSAATSSQPAKPAAQPSETNPTGIHTVDWTAYTDASSKIAFRLPGPLLSNNKNIAMDALTAVTYEATYQGRTVASAIVIDDPNNTLPITKQTILDFEAAKYDSRLNLTASSHDPHNFDITSEGAATVQGQPAYQATGETAFDSPSDTDGIFIDEFSAEIISFGRYKVIAECHGTNAEPSVSVPVRDAVATTVQVPK